MKYYSTANKFFITNTGEHVHNYQDINSIIPLVIKAKGTKISIVDKGAINKNLSIRWITFYTFNLQEWQL